MIVAIHQPQYLPWVPYFDKMDACDVFIYLDNVQYQKRGVQNRNQIKTGQGAQWLTVPVNASREDRITDVRIAENPWKAAHIRAIELNYARAPHSALFADEIKPILERPWESLLELNVALSEWFCGYLEIRSRRVRASELGVEGRKEELMINLSRAVGGTVYLSGSGAGAYQDPENFSREGIELRYQKHRTQPYEQCFASAGFIPDLSILDLVLNMGPQSREVLLAGREQSEIAKAAGT